MGECRADLLGHTCVFHAHRIHAHCQPSDGSHPTVQSLGAVQAAGGSMRARAACGRGNACSRHG
eukprot:7693544-Lingulodinium_polyedra.AAC.1